MLSVCAAYICDTFVKHKQLSYQEGSEHSNGREEVPNVVVVKEREQDTVSVVLTRFCWCFLRQARGTYTLTNPTVFST